MKYLLVAVLLFAAIMAATKWVIEYEKVCCGLRVSAPWSEI
jgi:hypothetical protein